VQTNTAGLLVFPTWIQAEKQACGFQ